MAREAIRHANGVVAQPRHRGSSSDGLVAEDIAVHPDAEAVLLGEHLRGGRGRKRKAVRREVGLRLETEGVLERSRDGLVFKFIPKVF